MLETLDWLADSHRWFIYLGIAVLIIAFWFGFYSVVAHFIGLN